MIFKGIIALISAVGISFVGGLTIGFFAETIGLHPLITLTILFFFGYKVVPKIIMNFYYGED